MEGVTRTLPRVLIQSLLIFIYLTLFLKEIYVCFTVYGWVNYYQKTLHHIVLCLNRPKINYSGVRLWKFEPIPAP